MNQILLLKKQIEELKEEVERLSAQEQAVKIVLNGKRTNNLPF